MKNRNVSQRFGPIFLFILIIGALYAFVPRPRAQFCSGCYGGTVTAGNVTWHWPAIDDDTNNTPPTLSTNGCGGVFVFGSAGILANECQPFDKGTTNVTIDVGQTEAKVDTTNMNGYFGYWVHDPKQVGQIKCEVTLTGTTTNWCDGNCTNIAIDAVGYICVTPCGGACGTCSKGGPGPSPGSKDADNQSIDFKVNFGATSPRVSYGWLWLKEDAATANLANPALLQVPYSDPLVEIIPSGGGTIEQINTPQMLINVHVINTYEYILECFYETNVTSKAGGLYGTNAPAFVTYTIQNPDGSSAFNRCWITEGRGGSTTQFQYTYTAASNRWDLLEPTGETLSTWKVPDASNVNITNYYRQVSVGSQLFSKDVQTFRYVPGAGVKLLLTNINGFGSVTQVTAYAYYASGAASNNLQEAIYPDGNWSYYTYDAIGRKYREYSAFGNSPAPTPGTEPNPTNDYCKMVQYNYSLNSTDDGIDDPGDPYNPFLERKVTMYLPGGGGVHEVSREYRWTETFPNFGLYSDEREQCPNPGMPYGDAENIKTTTYYNGGSGFAAGTVSQITHPDGSSTYFWYSDAQTMIEDDPDGSETTTIVDAFGNRQSRVKVNSGVVLSQTIYRYTNSMGVLYDPLMRTHDEIDLAERVTHYDYDCCTLESITDPDGVQTSYSYDDMKRLVTTTIYHGPGPGITTSNTLDAIGQILAITRFGTNSSIPPIVMEQYAYDAVGRVIAQTNALNGTTRITNVLVGGQLCITNVNPDGGMRIELHYLDGTIQYIKGTAEFGVQYTNSIEQDPPSTGPWRQVRTETKLDSSGSATSEWTETFTDGAGHEYLTLFAAASGPYPSQQSSYNSYGDLWKTVDPDGNIILYSYYDSSGDINQSSRQYTITALSATARGIADYSALVSSLSLGTLQNGIDRVTRQQKTVAAASGVKPDLIETDTYAWTNSETDGTGTLMSSTALSTTGLTNWTTQYSSPGVAVTTESRMLYSGAGHSIVLQAPDASYTTNWYPYGRLASKTKYDATPTQLGQTAFSYDVHGRTYQATDARNGATTYDYNNADQVSSVTTPNPGNGGLAETTKTYYNNMLQVTNVVNPDGTSVTNIYYLNGLLALTDGSRTYAVGYSYDGQGRTKTMTNWSDFPTSGARITTWNYDSYRGFLTGKTYDGSVDGPTYTYTPGGRIATRMWARGITTTYHYDAAGALTNIAYSDGSTSGVTNTFDRLGQLVQVEQSGLKSQYSYDLAGDLLIETNTAGVLSGLALTNGYDQYLRRTNMTALGSSILTQITYSYDDASRLLTVSDGTNSATYSYVDNSPRVSQITYRSNSVTRMTTTSQYDFLNRLTQVSNTPTAAGASSFNYTYDSANQRTRDTLEDGSYWLFQYDSLGQVSSAKKHWRDGTPVAGQQFEYTFDDIGNRTQTKTGGDDFGGNLRVANYTNDSLNRITGRDVSGYIDVVGIALATNNVTVDGQPAYRKGEYYRDELPLNNGSAAVWTNISVASPGQTTVSGFRYAPQSPEIFYYDSDGNLTNDGRWTYTWDAENRLIKMVVNTNVGPQYQLTFSYDSKGRRVQKFVSTNSVAAYTNRFLYDGWDLVGEINPANGAIRVYMWGIDVSGTSQDAGGVGGLLGISYRGNTATNLFVGFDGNGNVSSLVNAADGTIAARYEYGPFGEVLRASGLMERNNPLRFSTKYQDEESDLIYYGYRFYNSTIGRWLSRDSLNEDGGLNLYCFVENNGISKYDLFGLKGPDLGYETIDPPGPQECGRYTPWTIHWRLKSPAKKGGLVFQHITLTLSVYDCADNLQLEQTILDDWEELGKIGPNHIDTDGSDDNSRVGPPPAAGQPVRPKSIDDGWGWYQSEDPLNGKLVATGIAYFYDDGDMVDPPSYVIHPGSYNHNAPASKDPPNRDPDTAGAPAQRELTATWQCGGCTSDKTTLLSPYKSTQ